MVNALIAQPQIMDLAGSLSRGMAVGQQAQQARRQNTLADFYRQRGADVVSGDKQALNALAALDPQAAMGYNQTHRQNALADARFAMDKESHGLNMTLTRERIGQVRAEAKRLMAAEAQKLSAAEAKKEADETRGFIAAGYAALQSDDPAAMQAFASSNAKALAEMQIDPAKMTKADLGIRLAGAVGALEGIEEASKLTDGLTKKPADMPESEREIQRLMSIGMSYEEAVKIKEGGYKTIRDEITGEVMLIDMTTKRVVRPIVDSSDPNSTQNIPQDTQNNTQGVPKVTQTAPEGTQTIPKSTQDVPDARSAFGLSGTVKGAANTVSDFIGAGLPFQDVSEAQNAFKVFGEDLLQTIADGYNRQPPSWLLQRIDELTPSLTQGPDTARSKLKALADQFDRRAKAIDQSMKRRLSPNDRARLQSQLSSLQQSKALTEQFMQQLEPQSVTIDPEIEKLLDIYGD